MSIAKTQLTGGNFQDAMGNLLANGYLTMKLSQDSQVNDSQVCSGVEIKIVLDGNGDVAAYPTIPADQFVWANDVLSPINSFYTVTGYTAEGQPAFGPNNQQAVSGGIGGGTFDTGTWIPNQVVSWTPPLQVPQIFVNGTPLSSTQRIDFVDTATIDFTDAGNGEIEATGSGGLVLLESHTASGSAALNFTAFASSTYDDYMIEFVGVLPASNGVSMLMQVSTDGGSSYDSGSNYTWSGNRVYYGGTNQVGAATDTKVRLDIDTGNEIGNAASGGYYATVRFYNVTSSSQVKPLIGDMTFFENGTPPIQVGGSFRAAYLVTTAVNAFTVFFSTGNITSGTIRVYGITKS